MKYPPLHLSLSEEKMMFFGKGSVFLNCQKLEINLLIINNLYFLDKIFWTIVNKNKEICL